VREGTIERADGRTVSWARFGPPTGRPLLLLHGTPGSRLDRSPDPGLYDRVGAQVVTFNRPGYGSSSAQRDRTMPSVAADPVAVVDELGWDRFAVLGVSGGGPHALALCVHAPERVGAVGLAVGTTPADLIEPDDLIAVKRESRARALAGRESLEAYLAGPAAHDRPVPWGQFVRATAPGVVGQTVGRRKVGLTRRPRTGVWPG
jgi:pimeloyl-ACP methyl ester carboxylesterase